MDEPKTCPHCYHLGVTTSLERGSCPYCFLKDAILNDDYLLRSHPECFTDNARLDGHS